MSTYFVDCEFDGPRNGHPGPLLSIALIEDDAFGEDRRFYYVNDDVIVRDPWVRDNVVTIMRLPDDELVHVTKMLRGHIDVGKAIRQFVGDDDDLVFIADSPVDIGRLCFLWNTKIDGTWRSTKMDRITFLVKNVDSYPTTLTGCVQHNAYYDAMALRHKLKELGE